MAVGTETTWQAAADRRSLGQRAVLSFLLEHLVWFILLAVLVVLCAGAGRTPLGHPTGQLVARLSPGIHRPCGGFGRQDSLKEADDSHGGIPHPQPLLKIALSTSLRTSCPSGPV